MLNAHVVRPIIYVTAAIAAVFGEVFVLLFSQLLRLLRISAVVRQDDHISMRPRLSGGRGKGWLALAFDIPNNIKQDLGIAPIGLGRLIDDLLNNGQQLADFPTPAVLGDDDAFVQRFVQQSLQILGTRWAAPRIAGLAFLETAVRGRLAKADLVTAASFRRHWQLQLPNFCIHKKHPLYLGSDHVGNYCSQSRSHACAAKAAEA